ncbi:hypothetical protein FEM48_Zijuj04G0063200 [Ziziphus jujuba var. spinosa]|uniref:Serpin domain-containing protein n=1 Tax=Ziziphus jujuba var. spinosa TaxID=714518 RepID=A0A978VIA3_ZIZJJ|nr:hypothetical protein FEM48_Zijuj04G0063200 [Ziziphus jujuba var. spinosa]
MTQQRDFHLLNGQIVQVSFMSTQIRRRRLYRSFDGYKLVQIPYQSGQDARKFSMYFFLPNEKDGLPNLIQMVKLNSGFLNQQFKIGLENMSDFWIPKFKFCFQFEASETMKEMGLKLPFEPGEMTEMVERGNSDHGLYVSDILHKSYIEVNEEGTEAAASTAVRGSKGQTLQQLLHFLGSTSVGDLNLLSSKIISTVASPTENLEGGPLLSFVNGAWLDQRFILKPSFQEIAKDFYEAEIKNVDFEAKAKEVVEEVNLWARMATNGLIKQLFRDKSLDSETTLVLANALYFKGAWDQQFDPSMTQQRDFHLLNGQIVQAPFMTTKIFMRHLYGSFDGYKVLQIPYQSGQDARKFSMYFFLPSEQDGLPNLIQMVKLNSGFLNRQFKTNLESLPHLWIPKFKFSSEFEASETMKDMGLKLPFKPGEMTEMVDTGNGDDGIYVSDIFHKSYIEINEEGTEAAASTAVLFKCCAIIPTPSFVADHPFLFMIREETHGMVLFLGAVFNPLLDT